VTFCYVQIQAGYHIWIQILKKDNQRNPIKKMSKNKKASTSLVRPSHLLQEKELVSTKYFQTYPFRYAKQISIDNKDVPRQGYLTEMDIFFEIIMNI
jgi:hypothetical protein